MDCSLQLVLVLCSLSVVGRAERAFLRTTCGEVMVQHTSFSSRRSLNSLAALFLMLPRHPVAPLLTQRSGKYAHRNSGVRCRRKLLPYTVAMTVPASDERSLSLGELLQSDKLKQEAQCTVALIKNIVGSGVLVLPFAISRLSDAGASSSDAALLAIAMVLGAGVLNAWGFILIGEACAATKQGSYVGAWKETLGASAAFVPAFSSLLLCSSGAIANAAVIGDTCTDLLAAFLQVDYQTIPRNEVLAAVGAFALTPLCLLPSLAPLGSASVIGVFGVLLTAGAMTFRFFDGSYASDGALLSEIPVTPAFHAVASGQHFSPPSGLALAFFFSAISNAYVAHYNAPSIYNELAAEKRDPTEKEKTSSPFGLDRLRSVVAAERVNALFTGLIEAIPISGVSLEAPSSKSKDTSDALQRFRRVVYSGYFLSAFLFLIIAIPGFATFGDTSFPIIINNYASGDLFAVIARVGILASVLFEFPLLERPFRLTTLELFGNPEFLAGRAGAIASVTFLVSLAAAGVSLNTLSAFAGSTGGALLIYIGPALMTLRLREMNKQEKGSLGASSLSLWALASFGLGMGVLETVDTIR